MDLPGGIEYLSASESVDIPTKQLVQYSDRIRTLLRNEERAEIEVCGFETQLLQDLTRLLDGTLVCDVYVHGLTQPQLLDLAMLSFHLRIAMLQFSSMARLQTLLIDGGYYPNRAAFIRVWAMSHHNDPLRRLMLSSLYLCGVAFEGVLKGFVPKQGLNAFENEHLGHGRQMWFCDFHDLVQSNLQPLPGMPNKTLRIDWQEEGIQNRGAFGKVCKSIRKARENQLLKDERFFSFFVKKAEMDEQVCMYWHLQKRGYLPDWVVLPMRLPGAGEAVMEAPSRSGSKRKADEPAGHPPAKLLRRSSAATTNEQYPLTQTPSETPSATDALGRSIETAVTSEDTGTDEFTRDETCTPQPAMLPTPSETSDESEELGEDTPTGLRRRQSKQALPLAVARTTSASYLSQTS